MKKIKNFYHVARRYYNDYQKSRPFDVKMFNYQLHNFNNYDIKETQTIKYHWLQQFIISHISLKRNRSISVFGVNGEKVAIDINRSNYKFFFTIENVHVKQSPWIKYEDLLLENKKIDLSLGFDYIEHPQYLRFPFWLMTMFTPQDDFESIKRKCKLINENKLDFFARKKFCSFICRKDYFGDRAYFADQVSKVNSVNYPGEFRHNDDDLKLIFGDNKINYMSKFKFNLCPENSDYPGYVTEKIFDSFKAGCIPIYWGADNRPEPEVINNNSVFFLNLNRDNNLTLNRIKEINDNSSLYSDFTRQNRLTIDAPDIVFDYFIKLENKLNEIVK